MKFAILHFCGKEPTPEKIRREEWKKEGRKNYKVKLKIKKKCKLQNIIWILNLFCLKFLFCHTRLLVTRIFKPNKKVSYSTRWRITWALQHRISVLNKYRSQYFNVHFSQKQSCFRRETKPAFKKNNWFLIFFNEEYINTKN